MIVRFKINTREPSLALLQAVRKITGDSYVNTKRNIIEGQYVFSFTTGGFDDDEVLKKISGICNDKNISNYLDIYLEGKDDEKLSKDKYEKHCYITVPEMLRTLGLWEEIRKEQDEISEYEALEEEYTRAGKKYMHDENCKPVLIEDTGNDSGDDNS